MVLRITVIAVYALVIIVVGIIGWRKTRSFSDFFLGGRNIGPWMTAFTYGTTYFSAVLFVGFAGKIGWEFGYSGIWIAVGNALVGVLGVWWIMGPRIKKMATEYQVHTMAEYFEKRYESQFLKLLSAIAIFIFLIPYSAAVFMGLSYLFQSTFGISYIWALLFMGVFTAGYLVLGGYKSMTMIDVVFGMIMVVGVCILAWSVLEKGGGLVRISSTLLTIDPRLTSVIGPPGWWPLFSLVFLTSVAPFAMPQLIQKFYAVKDDRSIKIGMVASTFFALLIGGIGYFTGATTRYFLSPQNAPNAFVEGKPLFDALIPELLTTIIPDALSVVILLLILSASMSTLAALVLISSSALVKDLYHGFIRLDATDYELTVLMRTGSAFFIFLSVILAFYKPSTIVSILGISWGAIGAVFLGPFVWGLLSNKVNKAGALTSGVLGLVVCVYLYVRGMPSPQAGTLGMLLSLAINPLISLVKYKKTVS